MSLVRIKGVTKNYDQRLVLKDIFFRMAEGDRVGLIGPNGSGKTTLLNLLLQREEPTEGEVEHSHGVKIGYFSQFSELDSDSSIDQILEDVLGDVKALLSELEQIEAEMGAGPDDFDALLARQADALEAIERVDGWNWKNRIDTVLSKLGFSDAHRNKPIHQLSGGWRNRAALAKILLEEPDVLLLDEPTNYLDVEGMDWLETWIKKFRGAILVVSHDRHFLERIVTRIIELENYHLHEYSGSFADYVRERRLRLKMIQAQHQHEEELLVYEAEAIEDRKQAAKAPSEWLKRKLANIKKSVQPPPVECIVTSIYQNLRVSGQLLRVKDLGKAYDGNELFRGLTFTISKGDRLAIIGSNGCGKSTLLRIITGDEDADAGSVQWLSTGNGFAFSGVSFNHILRDLDPNEMLSKVIGGTYGIVKDAPRKDVKEFLSMFQFSELDMKQRIGNLSGGQKARVALALCLLSGAGLMILDEPTNHLDLVSTQVMEQALTHFPGAVVVVSHDRFFIDKIATRLLVFQSDVSIRQVEGNWTTMKASSALSSDA
ncbi:MAG: ABC-F family ATP-binding cassette domain-containing protein [Planctomycetota bacterium]